MSFNQLVTNIIECILFERIHCLMKLISSLRYGSMDALGSLLEALTL